MMILLIGAMIDSQRLGEGGRLAGQEERHSTDSIRVPSTYRPQCDHALLQPWCLPFCWWVFRPCTRKARYDQPYWNVEDPDFAQFVDTIGDGAGPDVSLDMLTTIEHTEPILYCAVQNSQPYPSSCSHVPWRNHDNQCHISWTSHKLILKICTYHITLTIS